MSLINTLHMAAEEERSTGASNAPITDGPCYRPSIPFCVHPPVLVGLSSLSTIVADAIGPLTLCEGRCQWLLCEKCVIHLCIKVLCPGITAGTDVNSCNKLLHCLFHHSRIAGCLLTAKKKICLWNIWHFVIFTLDNTGCLIREKTNAVYRVWYRA